MSRNEQQRPSEQQPREQGLPALHLTLHTKASVLHALDAGIKKGIKAGSPNTFMQLTHEALVQGSISPDEAGEAVLHAYNQQFKDLSAQFSAVRDIEWAKTYNHPKYNETPIDISYDATERAIARGEGEIQDVINTLVKEVSTFAVDALPESLRAATKKGEFKPMRSIAAEFTSYADRRVIYSQVIHAGVNDAQEKLMSMLFPEENPVVIERSSKRWRHIDQAVVARLQQIWEEGLEKGPEHITSVLAKEGDRAREQEIMDGIMAKATAIGAVREYPKSDITNERVAWQLQNFSEDKRGVIFVADSGDIVYIQQHGDTLTEANLTTLHKEQPEFLPDAINKLLIHNELWHLNLQVQGDLHLHTMKYEEIVPENARAVIAKFMKAGSNREGIRNAFLTIARLPFQDAQVHYPMHPLQAFQHNLTLHDKVGAESALRHLAQGVGMSPQDAQYWARYNDIYSAITSATLSDANAALPVFSGQTEAYLKVPYRFAAIVAKRVEGDRGQDVTANARFARIADDIRYKLENTPADQIVDASQVVEEAIKTHDPKLYDELQIFKRLNMQSGEGKKRIKRDSLPFLLPHKTFYEELMSRQRFSRAYGIETVRQELRSDVTNIYQVLKGYFKENRAYSRYFSDNFQYYNYSNPDGKKEINFKDHYLENALVLLAAAQNIYKDLNPLATIAQQMREEYTQEAATDQVEFGKALAERAGFVAFMQDNGISEELEGQLLDIARLPEEKRDKWFEHNTSLFGLLFDLTFLAKKGKINHASPTLRVALEEMYPHIEQSVWDRFQSLDLSAVPQEVESNVVIKEPSLSAHEQSKRRRGRFFPFFRGK